jgi:hypothetical protein
MNNWSELKIKKLGEWVRISEVYSTCHVKVQEYYYKQFNVITIVVILLGILGSFLEGANLLLSKQNLGVGITVMICTTTVSGLNLWLNSKNPAATAAAHENMSKGYNRIILKIECELTNDEHERENGVKFMNDIRDNLTDLSTGGHPIPQKIWEQFNKEFSASDKKLRDTIKRKSSTLDDIEAGRSDAPETLDTFDVNIFDPAAVKVAELLTKYQTARYSSNL